MGRTQRTYRQRLLEIRDRLLKYSGHGVLRAKYKELWVASHRLSAPSSTFPWPDTHAVATFSMLISVIAELNELEKQYHEIQSLTHVS